MATLTAKELTINDVHQLLKWNKQSNTSFSSLLSLESLTEIANKMKRGVEVYCQSGTINI